MPEPPLDELSRLVTAFGAVAAATAPVGLAAGRIARVSGLRRVWRRRPWRTNWTGFDALGIWLLAPAQGFVAVGGVVAIGLVVPAVCVGFAAWRRAVGAKPAHPAMTPRRAAALIAAGVAGWAVITPVTHFAYYVTLWICAQVGVTQEKHLLSKPPEDVAAAVLLFAMACVLAPVFEELAFRRVLVPWAAAAPYRSRLVMAAGAPFALSRLYGTDPIIAPTLFLVVLAAGYVGLVHGPELANRPSRPAAGAVYATAAFFGLAHSHVWPTPVPLFVLGLGLGYLTLRTRSVWPGVVAHGLFNAVAAVVVLRGPG